MTSVNATYNTYILNHKASTETQTWSSTPVAGILMIMIMIAFKGENQDFNYNLLTVSRTVSNTYAQVARAHSSANHEQHIQHLSHATCCARCHVVWRDSSDTKFDWGFLLFFFCVPSYISGVHHFWVRFLRMWPFFNPTIKVVTFRLRGWCVLGVFLLPAFTRLGHERQDLLSPCDEMHVCTD